MTTPADTELSNTGTTGAADATPEAAAPGLVALTAVVDETLDLAAHEAAVADPRAGAVVSFQGVVRDHDHGRGVTLLEYEGHPTAAAILREVAEEIAADPAVYAVAVSHRIGTLSIGDVALVMTGRATVKDWVPGESRHLHIGNHGGTSEDEMRIPLVVAKT